MEGTETVDALNVDIGRENKTFDVIGDVNSNERRSFWFKMKYNLCVDFLMFCPPKKNQEVDLRNHINDLKHLKAANEHLNKDGGSTLLSGRQGTREAREISMHYRVEPTKFAYMVLQCIKRK